MTASTEKPPAKAQQIAEEVRRRIIDRIWMQGDRIPDEADLAIEFGAARATVNKALQLLADEGLLDRRRRAGTRIAVNPVRKATFTIPIVREQIETGGMAYSHRVFAQELGRIPDDVAQDSGLPFGKELLHVQAVHYGDGKPFQYEDRWINPAVSPDLSKVDFQHLNANEWLVKNFTYIRADAAFSAENADDTDARLLGTKPGQALLILRRITWNDRGPITIVRIAYHPGFIMSAVS